MNLTLEQIAHVAHESNRAYCISIGDHSQPAWEDAPDWQKKSALDGVERHLANPNLTPEQSHQAWFDRKFQEGWRYGPTKNPATREHPCMLPYKFLPVRQQTKDYLFKAIVNALKPEAT
jgi:hypothetical protein